MDILIESFFNLPQTQKPSCQLFIGLTDLENVSPFIDGAIADLADEPVDGVQFGVKESCNFAGKHSDLPIVGPGH